MDNAVQGRTPSVLACLDQSKYALAVVRQARRLARQLSASWVVAHVASPATERASRDRREALLQAFRLAEELGGRTVTLNGPDPASELLAFAKREGITHIVLAASSRPRFIEILRDSPVQRVMREGGDLIIEICPRPRKRPGQALSDALRSAPSAGPSAYAAALGFVALATTIALPIQRSTDLPNISLIYVLAVISASIRYGAVVAAFTALMSALAYNFFMTRPYYSFSIYAPSDVWAVCFFLLVGFIVSAVAAHTRAQTQLARRQAREASDLRVLAQTLASARSDAAIARVTAETAARLLGARSVVMMDRHGELDLAAEAPGSEIIGGEDLAAARWTMQHAREAGRGAETLEGASWLFVPALGEHGVVAVLGVRTLDDASRLDPDQRRLLDLIANQAALALDRERFARDASDARVETEGERLRSMFLAGLSKDIRSPLTTIGASLEALARGEDAHDASTRGNLIERAREAAAALSGLVDHLLGAARLDHGVRPHMAPADVVDLVDAAIDRAHDKLEGHFVSKDVHSNLPNILVDAALTETALARVLENAGQNAPRRTPILVRAYREGDRIAIEVLDEGPGFPEALLPRVFERFEQGHEGDGRSPGAVLGLAVAKGFLEAEDATIEADNRPDRSGARVRMLFPAE